MYATSVTRLILIYIPVSAYHPLGHNGKIEFNSQKGYACDLHHSGLKYTLHRNPNGVFTPEQDTDKTNVEPVHSYDAFHTRFVGPGVKGIIGMYRFNICLVVLLWCENTITVCTSSRTSNVLMCRLQGLIHS